MKQVVLTFIFLSVSLAIAAPLLSFTDVCTLALTKNKYLLTKIEDYEIAKTQTDQAWATVLPSLKLESSYSKYHASLGGGTSAALTGFFTGLAQVIPSLNALMAGGSPFASENDTYTTKISVSQVIFGTHILPTLEASQSALKMAEANVNQQKQQLLSDVATQYFQLVKLEKNLTLLLDTKRSFEQHYKNTEELINNGFAYNNALLRIEVEMARIEKNILDLRNAEQNAKTAFSNFIGYPLAENFDLTFSLEVPFPVTDNFSLDFASIIDQRSDVQSIKQMILLLEANIALNASKSWPVLFAAGSYGYVNGQKFSFSDADKEWMVALSGSWQLFDGMSTAAKVDEARHNLKKMQIEPFPYNTIIGG